MSTTLIPLGVPTEIFSAAVGAGVNGTTYAAPARAHLISWQILFGTAPASITVNFQASNDGTTFTTIDSSTSVSNGSMRFTFSSARFYRINISAVSGGDTARVVVSLAATNLNDVFGGENAVLITQSSAVATAGTSEEDLFAFTLPARSLVTNGRSIRIRAWGRSAANGNTKVIRVYFGSDAFVLVNGAINNVPWFADCIVMRRAFSSQTRMNHGLLNGFSAVVSNPVISVSEIATISIRVTADGGAASDITLDGVIIETVPGAAGLNA